MLPSSPVVRTFTRTIAMAWVNMDNERTFESNLKTGGGTIAGSIKTVIILPHVKIGYLLGNVAALHERCSGMFGWTSSLVPSVEVAALDLAPPH